MSSSSVFPAFRPQGCAYHAKSFCRWGGMVVAPALDRVAFRASAGAVVRRSSMWQVGVFGFQFPEEPSLAAGRFAARRYAAAMMNAASREELAAIAAQLGSSMS